MKERGERQEGIRHCCSLMTNVKRCSPQRRSAREGAKCPHLGVLLGDLHAKRFTLLRAQSNLVRRVPLELLAEMRKEYCSLHGFLQHTSVHLRFSRGKRFYCCVTHEASLCDSSVEPKLKLFFLVFVRATRVDNVQDAECL